jgi:hypothetical protein
MTIRRQAADMVKRLYEELHTWEEVARVCNGDELDRKPSYYWRIAEGKIRHPGAAGLRAIIRGVNEASPSLITELNAPYVREPRFGLVVGRARGLRMRKLKSRLGLTWDEAAAIWEAALLREAGE